MLKYKSMAAILFGQLVQVQPSESTQPLDIEPEVPTIIKGAEVVSVGSFYILKSLRQDTL
jgi:hypothetical protein